jgi:two-component system, sensor histidine kinase and response regulator
MAPIMKTSAVEQLDRAAILERVEGDEDLLEEIVQLFIEDCPRLVGQMQDSLREKNAAGLRLAAHTLKGSLGYFGPSQACALACELEVLGRDGDLEQAAPIQEALIAKLSELQPALESLIRKPAHAK